MPKFSNQLIQGLLNPSYQGKLANAGMLIGSAPRGAREAEQRQAQLSQIMSTADTSRKAAQNGDVATAQAGLSTLNAAYASAKTKEDKQMISQQISQINSFMGSAIAAQKNKQESSAIGNAFKLTTVLDNPDIPVEQAAIAQQKLNKLMSVPKVAEGVMRLTTDKLDMEEKQAEAQTDAWEKQNSPIFRGLVENGQSKTAYKIAEDSGYGPDALKMIDAMVDRKNKLDKEAELKAGVIRPGDPLIESYRERAALLPESASDSVQATLSKIDAIYKTEDKHGMLKTGSQQQLLLLRGQVKTQLDRYEENVITTNFNAGVSEKKSVNNQIRKLEMMKLALPEPTKTSLLRVASRVVSEEQPPDWFQDSPEKFLKENPEKVFQEYRKERAIGIEQQIQALKESPEERQLRENGDVISAQLEAIDWARANPNDPRSKKILRRNDAL